MYARPTNGGGTAQNVEIVEPPGTPGGEFHIHIHMDGDKKEEEEKEEKKEPRENWAGVKKEDSQFTAYGKGWRFGFICGFVTAVLLIAAFKATFNPPTSRY